MASAGAVDFVAAVAVAVALASVAAVAAEVAAAEVVVGRRLRLPIRLT